MTEIELQLIAGFATSSPIAGAVLLGVKMGLAHIATENALNREAIAAANTAAQERLTAGAKDCHTMSERMIDVMARFGENSSAQTQATVSQTAQMHQLEIAVRGCVGGGG